MNKNVAALQAYFAFAKALRENVKTFEEFDRTIREVINHKSFGMTDDELTRSITVFGGHLE